MIFWGKKSRTYIIPIIQYYTALYDKSRMVLEVELFYKWHPVEAVQIWEGGCMQLQKLFPAAKPCKIATFWSQFSH